MYIPLQIVINRIETESVIFSCRKIGFYLGLCNGFVDEVSAFDVREIGGIKTVGQPVGIYFVDEQPLLAQTEQKADTDDTHEDKGQSPVLFYCFIQGCDHPCFFF